MKRLMTVLALVALAASPAAAQWAGMPVWNNPKGGTGIGVYAEYGKPNDDAGSGNAFGARASLGLGTLTLSAGVSSWEPKLLNERTTAAGATAAFRVIGGSLLPFALNVQVGAAVAGEATSGTQRLPKETAVTGAVGISASVPTPGLSIEPYLSPGLRYHKRTNPLVGQDESETNFGWTIGANLGFGMFGVHLAFDSEKFDDGTTHGTFGIGAHVSLRAPIGM